MTPELQKGLRAAREILREPPQVRDDLEPVIVVRTTDGSVFVDYAQNPFLGAGVEPYIVVPYPTSAHARLREIADIDARLAGGAV